MRGLIRTGAAWISLAGCASQPTLWLEPAVAAEVGVVEPALPAIAPRILASTPVPNPPEQTSANVVAVSGDPLARVAKANAAARVQPRLERYANATQIYVYSEGALYQVYTAPGQVTDIVLQPQERLSETGPVAAGDTTRWVIGDTESGAGVDRQVHILVKPTRPDLRTNLVINTDRRTYHLELRATSSTYMAAVSWRYPADEARAAAAVAQAQQAAAAQAMPAPTPTVLNFDYEIDGRASWRPVRVYDDGRQTFIEFPGSVGEGDMPPLFLGGPGRATELVNYRVHGRLMIVDRLFDAAELRLGDRLGQQRVRIARMGEGRR